MTVVRAIACPRLQFTVRYENTADDLGSRMAPASRGALRFIAACQNRRELYGADTSVAPPLLRCGRLRSGRMQLRPPAQDHQREEFALDNRRASPWPARGVPILSLKRPKNDFWWSGSK